MSARRAVADDAAAMQAIGAAAGERFRSVDDPRIARCADDPPMTLDELRGYTDAGRAFVAVDVDGRVVGFVLLEVLDEPAVGSGVRDRRSDRGFGGGTAHVEEVAVHPDAQGAGHGTALLDAAAGWARDHGLGAVTLTTFRDVPWNAPFHERRGFRVLAEAGWSEGLRAKVAEEAAHGLEPELRVVMRRDLP